MSIHDKRTNTFGFQSACYYTWETIPKPTKSLLKPFNETILYFTQHYSSYTFDTIIAHLPHSYGNTTETHNALMLELNKTEGIAEKSSNLKSSRNIDQSLMTHYPNYPYNLSNNLIPYKMRLRTPQPFNTMNNDKFRNQPPYSEVSSNRYGTNHNYFPTPRPSASTSSKSNTTKQYTNLCIKLGYGEIWNVSIPSQDWNIEFEHLTTIQKVCKYEPEILLQSLPSFCVLGETLAQLCKSLRSSLSKNTFLTIEFLIQGLSALKDNNNKRFKSLQEIILYLKKDDREALSSLSPNLFTTSNCNLENHYKSDIYNDLNDKLHPNSIYIKNFPTTKFATLQNDRLDFPSPLIKQSNQPKEFLPNNYNEKQYRTNEQMSKQTSRSTEEILTNTHDKTPTSKLLHTNSELNVNISSQSKIIQLNMQSTTDLSVKTFPQADSNDEKKENKDNSNITKDSDSTPASIDSVESHTSTDFPKPHNSLPVISTHTDFYTQKFCATLILINRCLKPLIHQSISDKKFICDSAFQSALMLINMSPEAHPLCLHIFKTTLSNNNAKISLRVCQLLYHMIMSCIKNNDELNLPVIGEMIAELMCGKLPATRQFAQKTIELLYTHFHDISETNFFLNRLVIRLKNKPDQRKLIYDFIARY